MEQQSILLLAIGIVGFFLTIIIWITGKKDNAKKEDMSKDKTIKIFNFNIDRLILIYFFIVVTLIFIGLVSNFYIPTIIGAVFAVIPIILFFITGRIKEKSKVK